MESPNQSPCASMVQQIPTQCKEKRAIGFEHEQSHFKILPVIVTCYAKIKFHQFNIFILVQILKREKLFIKMP